MCQYNLKRRCVNGSLTKMIISLHEQGYTEDFYFNGADCTLFSQHCPESSYSLFTVLIINQFYDCLTGEFKYIHLIETDCGNKGLLLANRLFIRKDLQNN